MQPSELDHKPQPSGVTTLESVIRQYGGGLAFCVTDYAPTELETVYAAINGPSVPLLESIGQTIEVAGFAVTPAQMEKPDGEVIQMPRLAIVAKDGKVFTCFSQFALQKWHQLTLACALNGGVKGRKIVVRAIPCKVGKTVTFDLVPQKGVKHGQSKAGASESGAA